MTYDFKKILKEEIAKVEAIGIKHGEIKEEIQVKKMTRCYGRCRHSKGSYQIILAKDFVDKAPLGEIRTTIVHEILHTIPDSKGHDLLWKNAVRQFKKAYENDASYLFLDFHLHDKPYSKERCNLPHTVLAYDDAKYVVVCTKCGKEFYYNRSCKVVKYPSNFKHSADDGMLMLKVM